MTGLGFLGYYLSAVVTFHGLQFISVGLERMVLFTYPTLVVAGSVLWLRAPIRPGVIAAIALTYSGIAIAWHGEATLVSTPADTLIGVGLVFLSAVTYAAFVILSGQMIREFGADGVHCD